MNKDQIRQALHSLLSGHGASPTQQMVAAITERVISTLDSARPDSAAFIAELENWVRTNSERERQDELTWKLYRERESADVIFILRNRKRAYIYEDRFYWWASKELLLKTRDD